MMHIKMSEGVGLDERKDAVRTGTYLEELPPGELP